MTFPYGTSSGVCHPRGNVTHSESEAGMHRPPAAGRIRTLPPKRRRRCRSAGLMPSRGSAPQHVACKPRLETAATPPCIRGAAAHRAALRGSARMDPPAAGCILTPSLIRGPLRGGRKRFVKTRGAFSPSPRFAGVGATKWGEGRGEIGFVTRAAFPAWASHRVQGQGQCPDAPPAACSLKSNLPRAAIYVSYKQS